MILYANTKDNFHTSIEFVPITQFQGVEIYFLINRCTNQSLKSNFFMRLFKHPHNLCFLEIIMDKLSFSLSIYSSRHIWLIIASNLACSINLWLRFLNLPHSVEQITCHLVTHYFSILLQNSPKKVSHSFICMFVYSNTALHITCFGVFLVEWKLDCFWP